MKLKLTYAQKQEILQEFANTNKTQAGVTAGQMASIIPMAIKLNMFVALDVVDELFENKIKLTSNTVTGKTTISSFAVSKTIIEKVDTLEKYVNFEMKKYQENILVINQNNI